MKIRTLIVDDESLARRLLRRLLDDDPAFEIVGECADGAAAVDAINRLNPDLVFLDLQMPELGGFEVLKRVERGRLPVIVFVTAYDEFALKAFAAHALDYIVKPVDEDRFVQTLERVKTVLIGQENSAFQQRLIRLMSEMVPRTVFRLAVQSEGRVVFLKGEEIDWIQAAGNYLELHVGKECHLLRGRLNELGRKLGPDPFFQIHRSTIVNLDRVKEFLPLFKGDGVVVLRDGTRLGVSRRYNQRLQELLNPQL